MSSELDMLLKAERDAVRATPLDRATYFVAGLMLALIPAFLFHAILDFEAEEHILIYSIVTLLGAAILSFAFHSFSINYKKKLTREREGAVSSKDGKKSEVAAKRAESARLTAAEGRAQGMLVVNGVFIASSLFLAYFLRYELATRYVLSVVLPATGLSLSSVLL